MARDPIRVLLVDDHRMFADSLARLLADEGIAVVAVASTVGEAVEVARATQPDVALLDHRLPDGTGLEAAVAIRAERDEVRAVILTGDVDDAVLHAAMEAGCSGFLTKDHAAEEVVRAVRAAAAGEVFVPPALLARLIPRLDRSRHQLGSDLSPRELEVLRLLATGASTKGIAAELHLSVNTVRNHIQQVLVKLDAHSKLEAVSIALQGGLVRYPGQ